MTRDVDTFLREWKNEKNRMPLLVRGARQVGKSHTVEKFGSREFEHCVVVDFELEPEYSKCFDGALEPKSIANSISLISGREIQPGNTLLFLDEIQVCPRAIVSLRYFYERLPELHVIAAGSLLEFALHQEDFRMPVGRVQYVYMYPLRFGEFLEATGHGNARQVIRAMEKPDDIPLPVHEKLFSLLHSYMVVGGMPAVVREFVSSQNIMQCQKIQATIAQTYRDDFGKYANAASMTRLQQVFSVVPKMVGRKFKYSNVDSQARTRELKKALELLELAGVLHRNRQTSGAGLPLEAEASDRNFKTLFLDVGLMQNLCGAGSEIIAAEDLLAVHAGAVTEQFVGQELIAAGSLHEKVSLYYWAREARSGNAEVDYLIAHASRVLPVEVKSGKSGTLRSLHSFLKQYGESWGVRVSQQSFCKEKPVLSIPLYAMESLGRLVAKALDS